MLNLAEPIEDVARQIYSLDHDQCAEELRRFPGMKLDFDDRYLGEHSTESLRHILLAAVTQVRRRGSLNRACSPRHY